MANNCLITKLKSAVESEDLPKLNCMRVKINASEVVLDIKEETEVPEYVTVTHVEGEAIERNHYTSSKIPYYIYIKNKYSTNTVFIQAGRTQDVTKILFETKELIGAQHITDFYIHVNPSGTIDDLKLNENMKGITFALSYNTGPKNVSGDISRFADLTTLQYLQLVDCSNVTGNLLDIKKLTNLAHLNLVGTKVTGDFVALAAAQIAYGREDAIFSDMRQLNFYHTYKFNNYDFPNSGKNIFSWTKSNDNYIVNLEQDSTTLTVTITNPSTDGTYTVVE